MRSLRGIKVCGLRVHRIAERLHAYCERVEAHGVRGGKHLTPGQHAKALACLNAANAALLHFKHGRCFEAEHHLRIAWDHARCFAGRA